MTAVAWNGWVGRSETVEDRIDVGRVRALQATLDDPASPLKEGDPLPPLWHWLYFWEATPSANLGPEGHAELGGFLPPIELPRRMWAGSRLKFPRSLAIGAEVKRHSSVSQITEKAGRNGKLVFVTVQHVVEDLAGTTIEEEHDIVYRTAPRPGETPKPGEPAPAAPPWQREIRPDPVLLFRYSALTFNGHRIHYDRDYATQEEGYPGLIVHGPLLAILMTDQARRHCPDRRVAAFAFRALSPIYDSAAFTVAGQPDPESPSAEVWVADPGGLLAMRGRMDFDPKR